MQNSRRKFLQNVGIAIAGVKPYNQKVLWSKENIIAKEKNAHWNTVILCKRGYV